MTFRAFWEDPCNEEKLRAMAKELNEALDDEGTAEVKLMRDELRAVYILL